jgi:class 3 adenylate cyclase
VGDKIDALKTSIDTLTEAVEAQTYSKIIKIFSMQMSKVIDTYHGNPFKPVGDQIIGIFLANVNFTGMSDHAILAAIMMRNVIEDVINPIFAKKGFPELGYHIGLDIGPVIADIVGARDVAAFNELLGHSMNVTGKIVSQSGHNEIFLGRSLFELIHNEFQAHCEERTPKNWSIQDPDRGGTYQIYRF